jgi:hypothetical protein
LKDLARNKWNSIEIHCSPFFLIVDLKTCNFCAWSKTWNKLYMSSK